MFEIMCIAAIIVAILVIWWAVPHLSPFAAEPAAPGTATPATGTAITPATSTPATGTTSTPAPVTAITAPALPGQPDDNTEVVNRLFERRVEADGDTRLAAAMHHVAVQPLESILARARMSADSARAEYEEELAASEALATKWDDDSLDERMVRRD